jgi:hypothetical protein
MANKRKRKSNKIFEILTQYLCEPLANIVLSICNDNLENLLIDNDEFIEAAKENYYEKLKAALENRLIEFHNKSKHLYKCSFKQVENDYKNMKLFEEYYVQRFFEEYELVIKFDDLEKDIDVLVYK